MAEDETAEQPATTTPTEDAAFVGAVAQHVAQAALSIDNTDRIAENLKDWIAEHFPERVATAYWVTLTGHRDRDKGIAVEIARLPADLHAKALAGAWSAGLGVFTDDFDLRQFHMKAAIGAGAVVRYSEPSKLLPFFGFTVSFK